MQGQKFFDNKIFAVSSYNSSVQKSKIVAIDPVKKKIVSEFDNLPSQLANSEVEDLAFVLEDNKYYIVAGTRTYYIKLIFWKEFEWKKSILK